MREPIPEPDPAAWLRWYEKAYNLHVAKTEVGKIMISTTFLAIDHSHGGEPILWGTFVNDGIGNYAQARCGGSVEQAMIMHREMVEKVREARL